MPISTEELQDLRVLYPYLQLKAPYKVLTIGGSIRVNHVYNDFPVNEKFNIDIKIASDYPYSIPTVIETGNKISRDYEHIYSNGTLCLGIDGEIMFGCNGVMNLKYLLSTYVIPYLFSYRYYERFNSYPFGQRSHGGLGILESYIEYFDLQDIETAYLFLKYAVTHSCSGHLPCPCNSGNRIRNCHFNVLRKIDNNSSIKRVIKNDLAIIEKELNI